MVVEWIGAVPGADDGAAADDGVLSHSEVVSDDYDISLTSAAFALLFGEVRASEAPNAGTCRWRWRWRWKTKTSLVLPRLLLAIVGVVFVVEAIGSFVIFSKQKSCQQQQ